MNTHFRRFKLLHDNSSTMASSTTTAVAAAAPKLANETEIPRTKAAESLIRTVILEDFSESLNIDTLKYGGMMDMHMYSIATKADPSKFLSIWVNAMDAMTSGGRSVEAGEGPNYYKTIGELREALQSGLDQLLGTTDADADDADADDADADDADE
jgi:hypothetical protein